MKLKNVKIIGRNWLGAAASKSKAERLVTAIVDPVLCRFPGLCSNIYLVGHGA